MCELELGTRGNSQQARKPTEGYLGIYELDPKIEEVEQALLGNELYRVRPHGRCLPAQVDRFRHLIDGLSSTFPCVGDPDR